MKNLLHPVLSLLLKTLLFIQSKRGTVSAQTIKIGNQDWITKNPDTDTFRNGEPITEAQTKRAWKAAVENKQPAWCWYESDPSNGNLFGRLYNWYSVIDSRGLCPAGWHVPTNHDWNLLMKYLDPLSDRINYGLTSAAGKMKSIGTIQAGTGLWQAPNTDANNSCGFEGFPGGCRSNIEKNKHKGIFGLWWSSTESTAENAFGFFLAYSSTNKNAADTGLGAAGAKPCGYSIRCLKD